MKRCLKSVMVVLLAAAFIFALIELIAAEQWVWQNIEIWR